jgi:thiamine kinase-like enzyme
MPPRDVVALCRAVVPGQGAVSVEPLGSGLLSDTYRVVRDGNAYTLKLGGEGGAELGADLGWEVRLLNVAAAAGLAPPVVYVERERRALLTRWVAGRPWSRETARSPAAAGRIAEMLHRVHGLPVPEPARHFSPAQWCDLYGAALTARRADAGNAELRSAAAVRLGELAQMVAAPPVICHSDLHAMNLIEENDSLILLDWEYAHAADPLWDLAGWSANNDLDAEAQWLLLTRYLRRPPTSGEWRRLRLNLWLYDCVCLLWSRLYLVVRGDAGAEIAERARLLDARLRLAANYAA